MPQDDLGLVVNDIVSLTKSGTGAPGTVDTYTFTLRNGKTFSFQVTNGANGATGGVEKHEFTTVSDFTDWYLTIDLSMLISVAFFDADYNSMLCYIDNGGSNTKLYKMLPNGNMQELTALSSGEKIVAFLKINDSITVPVGGVKRENLADSLKPKMLLQYTSTDYKDLNTAPKNAVLCYSGLTSNIGEYSHYPVDENGTLLVLNGWDGASASSNLGDVQVYVTYTGRIFSRSVGANNVFTPWKELIGTDRSLYIYLADLSFRDFNTVPKNSCICFVSMNDSAYSHYPTLENGTLFTYNAYASPTYPDAVTVQMYFTQDSSKVFVRSCKINTWTNWVELAVNDNSFFKAFFAQNANYKDFDNAPNNSVICYSNSSWDAYSNYPVATYGTLITYNGYNANSNIAKTQIYITSANDMYIRVAWGAQAVFSAWSKFAKYDAAIYTHKYKDYIKKPYNFNGKSAVFFGDSITYGWLSGNNRVEHPWPELFSNEVGLTGYNEAVSASAFSPNSQSQTNIMINQAINSTHKNVDFVFCAGGTNDCGFGVSLSDLKTNVNNFIDYVLENYPNAQLIFITPIARLDGYENSLQAYRNIITECAIAKDTGRISVVQGNDFDFPVASDSADFRSTLFADSVHPAQKGYSTAYLYGLLKALI